MKGWVGGGWGEEVVEGGLKRGRRRRRWRRLGDGGVAITGATAAAGAEAESGAATNGAITNSAAGDGGEVAGAAVGATAAGGGGLAKAGGAITAADGAFAGDRYWPMECRPPPMPARIGKTCENVTCEVGGTGVISEASTEGAEAERETTVEAVMDAGGWAEVGDGTPDGEEEEARRAATSSRSREFSALSAATSRRSCCKATTTSCPNWVWTGE